LLLDQKQTKNGKAEERFDNFDKQALQFSFPSQFDGKLPVIPAGARPKAAIIREKGSNSEREMANAMFLAGFDVKDVHMTDLISGRETLEDIQFIGAVGGFSNSDVLGSAKGWAGAFLYNEKAKTALQNFYKREYTLSLEKIQLFHENNCTLNAKIYIVGKLDLPIHIISHIISFNIESICNHIYDIKMLQKSLNKIEYQIDIDFPQYNELLVKKKIAYHVLYGKESTKSKR
jgi:hypothetical protein